MTPDHVDIETEHDEDADHGDKGRYSQLCLDMLKVAYSLDSYLLYI